MSPFPAPPWHEPGLDVLGVLRLLPPRSSIADVGCWGWTLARACGEGGLVLHGLDREEPPGRPDAALFHRMHGPRLELDDDSVDLAVASHVLEHMTEPVELFAELARIAKPSGLIWVESPSELMALAPSTDTPDDHSFRSFWDDPTHVRPWPPAALYRLALSFGCLPLACTRGVTDALPVTRLLARKPEGQSGRPRYRFVSLRGVPPGLEAALAHADMKRP